MTRCAGPLIRPAATFSRAGEKGQAALGRRDRRWRRDRRLWAKGQSVVTSPEAGRGRPGPACGDRAGEGCGVTRCWPPHPACGHLLPRWGEGTGGAGEKGQARGEGTGAARRDRVLSPLPRPGEVDRGPLAGTGRVRVVALFVTRRAQRPFRGSLGSLPPSTFRLWLWFAIFFGNINSSAPRRGWSRTPLRRNSVVDSLMTDLTEGLWSRVQSEWRIRDDTLYLNHGSFGPSPIAVQTARRRWQEQLESQPMDFFVRHFESAWCEARGHLARFVGAAAEDLIFVENATAGMNLVAHNYPLKPGDDVLLTDHEYGAVRKIWQHACNRAARICESFHYRVPSKLTLKSCRPCMRRWASVRGCWSSATSPRPRR